MSTFSQRTIRRLDWVPSVRILANGEAGVEAWYSEFAYSRLPDVLGVFTGCASAVVPFQDCRQLKCATFSLDAATVSYWPLRTTQLCFIWDPKSVRIVKASDTDARGQPYLPEPLPPASSGAIYLFCVPIDASHRYALIPSFEIFRYFYASSRELLRWFLTLDDIAVVPKRVSFDGVRFRWFATYIRCRDSEALQSALAQALLTRKRLHDQWIVNRTASFFGPPPLETTMLMDVVCSCIDESGDRLFVHRIENAHVEAMPRLLETKTPSDRFGSCNHSPAVRPNHDWFVRQAHEHDERVLARLEQMQREGRLAPPQRLPDQFEQLDLPFVRRCSIPVDRVRGLVSPVEVYVDVEELDDFLRNIDGMEPPIVHIGDGELVPVEGFAQLAAAVRLGRKEVVVDLVRGSLNEARLRRYQAEIGFLSSES